MARSELRFVTTDAGSTVRESWPPVPAASSDSGYEGLVTVDGATSTGTTHETSEPSGHKRPPIRTWNLLSGARQSSSPHPCPVEDRLRKAWAVLFFYRSVGKKHASSFAPAIQGEWSRNLLYSPSPQRSAAGRHRIL